MNSKKSIAVYGLSTETEKELPQLLEKYNIVGLLDGFRTDGELYGLPIISMKAAIGFGITKIIVVARPGSCKAIAKRIGDVCKTYAIELFDIRGRNLLEDNRVTYDFKNLAGYTKNDLIKAVQNSDIVSFDLFDTLIIRSIPLSSDVAELVEYRINEVGMGVDDFANRRIEAEKKLSQNYAPRLAEIYEKAFPDTDEDIRQGMMAIEFLTDTKLITVRKDMLVILQYAHKMGKKVCITSDCYYEREWLSEILTENSICAYDELFVSCEYGKSKNCGLFEVVKEYYAGKSILHIGDDCVADIKYAKEAGLRAFQIYSGMELFDALGGLGMEAYMHSISDKIKVGLFISKILNSPFQFENENCRLRIESGYDMGYGLCAPIINDFTLWFGEKAEELACENILFGARDGYLVEQLFSLIYPEKKSQYFYISRTSVVRAGVENEDDLQYIESMKYSGTTEEMLNKRFGICVDSLDDSCKNANGIMNYSEDILMMSRKKRENYLKYIDSLMLDDGSIAFFDFVAKGTCQLYAQKLVSNPIKGIYFLQLEPEFMKDKGLEIYPFYSESEREESVIFSDYYILETILTSPEASVEEFDVNGKPIFARETRGDEDIRCIMNIQDGISEYVRKYVANCPKGCLNVNKQLDEKMLSLIHNIDITDGDFLNITVEDPFFNRMTNIRDLL